MNNPRTLPANKTRELITEDLGYCCEYKFFSLYKDVSLIAARLGMAERTIRRHKQHAAEGILRCENCSNCMKASVK